MSVTDCQSDEAVLFAFLPLLVICLSCNPFCVENPPLLLLCVEEWGYTHLVCYFVVLALPLKIDVLPG